MRTRFAFVLVSALAAIPACATDAAAPDAGDVEDGANDSIGGKTDSPTEGSAAAAAILAVVNDTGVDSAKLDNVVGLSTKVSDAITKYRDGADQEPGTADDKQFATLAQLDAIPYVGPTVMTTIGKYAKKSASTAKLRIDLEVTDGDATVALESLNAQLAGTGVTFGKTLELGQHDGRKFLKVLQDIKTANDKLHRDLDIEQTWDPSQYIGLCYTGDIKQLPQTIDDLRYSLFSVYMGIQAERYGTFKKVYADGGEAAWIKMQREENGADAQCDVWEHFSTSSTNYLMMSDGGEEGDGTEFFAVNIPKCQ
ncbi:MAG TPA: hypothetical protein VGM90_08105 [Kofleriaceae bacterium]